MESCGSFDIISPSTIGASTDEESCASVYSDDKNPTLHVLLNQVQREAALSTELEKIRNDADDKLLTKKKMGLDGTRPKTPKPDQVPVVYTDDTGVKPNAETKVMSAGAGDQKKTTYDLQKMLRKQQLLRKQINILNYTMQRQEEEMERVRESSTKEPESFEKEHINRDKHEHMITELKAAHSKFVGELIQQHSAVESEYKMKIQTMEDEIIAARMNVCALMQQNSDNNKQHNSVIKGLKTENENLRRENKAVFKRLNDEQVNASGLANYCNAMGATLQMIGRQSGIDVTKQPRVTFHNCGHQTPFLVSRQLRSNDIEEDSGVGPQIQELPN